MSNKVEFGISNLYVGTYTDNNGTVTLGTPYHQAGAVSFSPEENSEQNNFYADNIVYWSGYSGGTIEGDLEVIFNLVSVVLMIDRVISFERILPATDVHYKRRFLNPFEMGISTGQPRLT